MKITNAFFEQNTIEQSQGNLPPLVRLCQCTQLPAKTSYWLSRLLSALEPLNKVYADERKKLIEKWCDKNEDGTIKQANGQCSFGDHLLDFDKEFQELLSIDLSIDMNPIEIALDTLPTGILNSYDFPRLEGMISFKE